MNDPRAAATSDTSLVLALAVWLVLQAPQWALLAWGVRSLGRIREAVARSFGWKLLAAASWMTGLMLAMIGTVWVCRDLLGPERLGAQYIVVSAWFVQEGLLIVATILASRHRTAGSAPAPKVRKQPLRRELSRMLLGWVVTAVVLVALALGPFAGRPAQVHIWLALAFAVAGICMTIVLLFKVARRTPTKDGDGSTGSRRDANGGE